MPEPGAARRWGRRLAPWLALLLLFVSDYAVGAKWDVKDTHERLDRIYDELGLDKDE